MIPGMKNMRRREEPCSDSIQFHHQRTRTLTFLLAAAAMLALRLSASRAVAAAASRASELDRSTERLTETSGERKTAKKMTLTNHTTRYCSKREDSMREKDNAGSSARAYKPSPHHKHGATRSEHRQWPLSRMPIERKAPRTLFGHHAWPKQ